MSWGPPKTRQLVTHDSACQGYVKLTDMGIAKLLVCAEAIRISRTFFKH